MRNAILGTLVFVFMIAAPLVYNRWVEIQYRNFHVVQEGVLYRSGQLPLRRLQELVANHGIRTIVCLRHGNKDDDLQEETWVKAKGLKHVRIKPPNWNPDATGKVPADAALQSFREVMDDPANYPVLVHCFAGYHRTGAMCAVFRMDYQGWSNSEAIAEMRLLGYQVDHEDVLGYLTKYRSPIGAPRINAVPVKLEK